MKRQLKLWGSRVLMVALLVVAISKWGLPVYSKYFKPKKTVVYIPQGKVRYGDFTVSFHEIGTLAAESSVPVFGEDNGKLIYLVAEGTIVKTGDVIAELDRSDIDREIRNQKLTVNNAEAEVARVEEEYRMLVASNQTHYDKQKADYDFTVNELEMAKKTLEKKKRLADEKLVPRDQVEQAELAVRSKELAEMKGKKDLELQEADNQSKENQKKADLRKVKFALDTQQRTLDELQTRISGGTIKAPAPGMVVISKTWQGPGDFRKIQEGDTIRMRQSICLLPDLSKMLVRVNVGESDAPRITMGMPVVVKMEAIPGKTFHGTVSSISSLATEGNPMETGSTPGRKNFEVSVALKESDPKTIKPGMTADAEFICDAVKNVLYVPLEAVVEKDGKTQVFVKTAKGFERRVIDTGLSNDSFVIVKRGLDKNTVIALRDPTRAMDHQEAGSNAPGSSSQDNKDKKQTSPLPEMPNSGAAKK